MFANDEIIDTEYSYKTLYDIYITEMKTSTLDHDVKKKKKLMEKIDNFGLPYGLNRNNMMLMEALEIATEFIPFRDDLYVYELGGKFRLCYDGASLPVKDFLEINYYTREIRYLDFTVSLTDINKELYILLRKLNPGKINIVNAELVFTNIDLIRNIDIDCISFDLENLTTEMIAQIFPNTSDKIKCDMITLYGNKDLITTVLSYFDPLIIGTNIAPPVYIGMKICYLYEESILDNIENDIFIHRWPISLGGSLPENGDGYNIILFKYTSDGSIRERSFTNTTTGEEIDYKSLVDMMRFMRYSTKSARS